MEENIKKKLARNWFLTIQELICHEIENIEMDPLILKRRRGLEAKQKMKAVENQSFLKTEMFLRK